MIPAHIAWNTTKDSLSPKEVIITDSAFLLYAPFEKSKVLLRYHFNYIVQVKWSRDFGSFWKHTDTEVVQIFYHTVDKNKVEILNSIGWQMFRESGVSRLLCSVRVSIAKKHSRVAYYSSLAATNPGKHDATISNQAFPTTFKQAKLKSNLITYFGPTLVSFWKYYLGVSHVNVVMR